MVMAFLAVAVAAYALAGALVPDIRGEFLNTLFSEKGLRIFGHLVAGGTALAVGAFQFNSTLRRNRPAVHRLLGKIYVIAVLFSGVAALLLAPFSDGGITGHFGFGMLGALWLTTTVLAYLRARSGDFASHQNWMIRSYALCLAAVTLRIYLPASQIAGYPFEEFYPAISWLCWVPNLVIAEWFFVRTPR